MANNKGFPSNPSQLTSAVRKALFTSAAVTAIAVGAPGHNAYAQQVGVCNPIETEFTSGTVQCSGDFDATIDYAVDDVTVVDGTEQPADIKVVVAEGSTGTGISVSSLPADASSEPAEGSVVIENHGDLQQAPGSELEINPDYIKTYYNRAIHEGQRSGVVWTGIGGLEDGSTFREDKSKRSYFDEGMTRDEVVAYMEEQGYDPASIEDAFDDFNVSDREEQFDVVIAPAGSLEFDDVAAVSAETDAGSIDIVNTGNISMGDGLSLTYYTSASYRDSHPDWPITAPIDTDGDGVKETILIGEQSTVRLWGERESKAFTVGVDATSVTGDINVENQGSIATGDTSYGVRLHTADGDIAISNSGDIVVGADATGIHASSEAQAGLVYQYNDSVNETYFKRGNPFFGIPDSYVHATTNLEGRIYSADGADNRIAIANSGSITAGSGSVAIEAFNPSGDAIEISNSGDITLLEGEGGAAIVANTHAGFETEYTKTQSCVPGAQFGTACPPVTMVEDGTAPNRDEPDFNADGKYYTATHFYVDFEAVGKGYIDDHGDIAILNSGSIDISAATGAKGIHASSYGSIAIENAGTIAVGQSGIGIATNGVADTTVLNSGDISLAGGDSMGISVDAYVNPSVGSLFGVAPEMSAEEIYAGFDSDVVNQNYAGFNGEVSVLNSGSIAGSVEIDSALTLDESGNLVGGETDINSAGDIGIKVRAGGASGRGQDIPWSMYSQESMEAFFSGDVPESREGLELFTTRVTNTGDIALGDLSTGILAAANYGEVVVVNGGSVSVGEGIIVAKADGTNSTVRSHSKGVSANSVQGVAGPFSNNTVLNTADGMVSTGDLGIGLEAVSVAGDAYVLNNGVVTVGSGETLTVGEEGEYGAGTRLMNSTGIKSNVVLGLDNNATAVNNGSVATGDYAYGMFVSNVTGPGFLTQASEHAYEAMAINNGTLTTGDNSVGIGASGYTALGLNTGDITIGSTDNEFGIVGAGMKVTGGIGGTAAAVMVNEGTIIGGDGVYGIAGQAFVQSITAQGEDGSIHLGDNAVGMGNIAYFQASNYNAGSITTGDNSIGMRTYAIVSGAVNTGDISVGDDSTGISVIGASSYANNTGDIRTGANGTGIEVYSAGSPAVVVNSGNVTTGDNGVALEVIGQDYLDLASGQVIANLVFNSGNVTGSIITGDSDDVLRNGFRYDNSGNVAGVGRITLNDASIDMGAGRNTFINEAGDIVFSGDSAIELGAQGTMVNYSGGANYVTISSLDDQVGDTLTINGDVTFANIQSVGSLFLVDVSSTASDNITINGDLNVVDLLNQAGDTQPGDLRVAMNVTDQSKGAQTTGAILTVNGEQNVDSVSLAALGGDFADTILEAEMQQDGNGNWVIAYTAGLSDLGAAASSVSHLAESFWNRSATAFFDTERAANMSESSRVEGLHAWSSVFHTDSDVESRGDVKGQDLAYTQLLSNHMAGATYNTKLGGTWLSISPMVGKGYADGNQLAQQSSAALDTETFALNGTLSMGDFYASAMVQQVDFDANVRAYDSAAMTSGQAKGYSLEGGWTYLMESGIAMTSYAQWSDVKSEVDGFTSSDSNFDYAYNLGSTSTTRLGLSMRKSFKLSDGFAMPYASFSVADSSNHSAHDLHSNGVVFNSDVSGTGFNLDFGVDGKYKLWNIKSGLGVHSGETDKNGLSAHFAISRSL